MFYPFFMSKIQQLVDTAVKSSKVVVFSKSFCPYCIKAKNLLKSKNVTFELFELDQRDDGSVQLTTGAEIQQYLAKISGQTTVPNIFIQSKHVGGCRFLVFNFVVIWKRRTVMVRSPKCFLELSYVCRIIKHFTLSCVYLLHFLALFSAILKNIKLIFFRNCMLLLLCVTLRCLSC
jgi:glutaredoxin 3